MGGSAARRWGVVVLGALAVSLLLLMLAPLALPPSYSWVELGTSEAAAQGVDGAWVARAGFVLLGLAVLGVCALRYRAWQPLATGLHACFALGLVLVAVYSHAPWEEGVASVESEDRIHSVFASVVGFSFIAGVATTLVVRRPRTRWSAAGDVAALLVAATVPMLMATPVWGVLQRLLFATAAAWYAGELRRQAVAGSGRSRESPRPSDPRCP